MAKTRRDRVPIDKLMAKYARWMRNGGATFHEQVTNYLLSDLCKQQNLTMKNQKIFCNKLTNKWYIVDFWIEELQLVIEIDGSSHNKTKKYDAIRTEFLESVGNKVVRFKNAEVETLQFRDMLLKTIKDGCTPLHDTEYYLKSDEEHTKQKVKRKKNSKTSRRQKRLAKKEKLTKKRKDTGIIRKAK